tara:strand:+ start:87 stop:464 length:378 start_codon:yes stop_codon:yes gene_type:complete
MRSFRNNNKRPRYRSNGDKNFKRNGQNNSFIEGQNFQRKSPGRNNQNANKLIDKYSDLAREALSNGDKILSENYFQHADHFLRISNDKDKNFTKDINEIQKQEKNVEISENNKTVDQNQDRKNIV